MKTMTISAYLALLLSRLADDYEQEHTARYIWNWLDDFEGRNVRRLDKTDFFLIPS